jgi:hypothetical protein
VHWWGCSGWQSRFPRAGSIRAARAWCCAARTASRSADTDEAEVTGNAATRTRSVAEGRIQRVGGGAESGATHRGINSYLDVQHGTLTEPFGGELVGIDIYV